MKHDKEVILTLARVLRESETRRAAWQKTAESHQDRADANDRKFKEVVDTLKGETELEAKIEQLREVASRRNLLIQQLSERVAELEEDNIRWGVRVSDLSEHIRELEAKLPVVTRQPYEFQVWNCHDVCVEQWPTYDEAVLEAARCDAVCTDTPHRVIGVYLDAPPALTQRQHIDALVALGAERTTTSEKGVNILILPDTGADDAT